MNKRLIRLATGAIIAIATAASLVVYSDLPTQMVTQWGATGEATGTLPKLIGAFVFPAAMLGLTGLMYLVLRIDPWRENITDFQDAYEWFIMGAVAFIGYLHVHVLLWNLGYQFPFNEILAPPVAALLYAAGMLLNRVEPNWFVGVRTPWTISDEEVWERTHERAAPAFKIAGILALGGLISPDYFLLFIVGPLLIVTVYLIGFSFFAYRNKHHTG